MTPLDLENKRTNGQYFTQYNPFDNTAFQEWARECNLQNNTILEPFAGRYKNIQKFLDALLPSEKHNIFSNL